LKIDLTPPVITPSVTPPPNAAGWNNTDVTVAFTVGDPVSGIASAWPDCAGASLAAETAGTTLTCSAANGAGLSSAAPVTVRIDRTKPVVSDLTLNRNPAAVNTSLTLQANVDGSPPGGSLLTSAELSLDGGPFSPAQAADGAFDETAEAVTAVLAAFTTAGVHSLCLRGTDAAGNVSEPACLLFAIYDPEAGYVIRMAGGGRSPRAVQRLGQDQQRRRLRLPVDRHRRPTSRRRQHRDPPGLTPGWKAGGSEQQGRIPGLPEVLIFGQSLLEAQLTHEREAEAIRERPLPIPVLQELRLRRSEATGIHPFHNACPGVPQRLEKAGQQMGIATRVQQGGGFIQCGPSSLPGRRSRWCRRRFYAP
jgi:hypothetical protein